VATWRGEAAEGVIEELAACGRPIKDLRDENMRTAEDQCKEQWLLSEV